MKAGLVHKHLGCQRRSCDHRHHQQGLWQHHEGGQSSGWELNMEEQCKLRGGDGMHYMCERIHAQVPVPALSIEEMIHTLFRICMLVAVPL